MKILDILIESEESLTALHRRTGFWGKAGAGGIVYCISTKRFLLGLRSEDVDQPGTWGGFGGAVDRDEDVKTAALREISEEIGLDSSNIEEIKKSYVYFDNKTNFKYTNFIVIVKKEFTPTLNWENDKAEWFDIGSIPSPLHFGLKSLFASTEFKNFLNNQKNTQ